MPLTVGQLAKLSGLSVRSLHHYDEIGLLCPSERSDAGYRLYSDSDVERLNRIQALRWLDLPLSEVKGVLDRGGSAVPEVVDRKIAALTRQIDEATDLRTRLMTLRNQVLQGQVPAMTAFSAQSSSTNATRNISRQTTWADSRRSPRKTPKPGDVLTTTCSQRCSARLHPIPTKPRSLPIDGASSCTSSPAAT
jgi:DNA-binding transcriptional MerR regulator